MKTKRSVAIVAILVLSVVLLTGCGEVGMAGSCTPNGNGTYSYSWFVHNNVPGSPDLVVSGVWTSPTASSAGPASWVGWTIPAGSSVGAFNTESFAAQDLVVETHPVGSTVTALNHVNGSC